MTLKQFYMSRTVGFIVVLLVFVAGYWALVHTPPPQAGTVQEEKTGDLGSYPYVCDNGLRFTMVPYANMEHIRLSDATYEGASLSDETLERQVSAAGVRYQHDGVVFLAQGETVHLVVNASTTTCTPVPDQNSAPFNFGD